MFCAPTAEDLGLPAPSLPEIIEMLGSVPFQPAMMMCSVVAAELFHHPRDRVRHAALSAELHAPWLAERMHDFLGANETHLLSDQRHVAALQRLLVTYAASTPKEGFDRGLTTEEIGHVLGGPARDGERAPPARAARYTHDSSAEPGFDRAGWASFAVRAGAWYDEPYWSSRKRGVRGACDAGG